jgi:hypothetical protein
MSFGHQIDVFIETSKHQKSCRYPTGGEKTYLMDILP